MPTTLEAIYLGNHAPVDPTEGNLSPENAAAQLGATLCSSGSLLYNDSQTLSPYGCFTGSWAADYDRHVDSETFFISGDAVQTIGVAAPYNATLAFSVVTIDTGINTITQNATGGIRDNVVSYADNSQFGTGDSLTFAFAGTGANDTFLTEENTGDMCFATGTRIATSRGAITVEDLSCGDMVQTADHGLQPILWIGQRHLDNKTLQTYPDKAPIKIPAQTFGNTVDVYVSPLHGILVGPKHGFQTEMFVRAKHLLGKLPGVTQVTGNKNVRYVHILLPQHEVIYADGMPTESFYPRFEALQLLQEEPMKQLTKVLPEVQTSPPEHHYGPTARPFVKRKEVAFDIAFVWGQSVVQDHKFG